ncbi:MAG: 16S rRNA (uracil(1498)-N(3))-methyltransferase [Formosimonas sp.]
MTHRFYCPPPLADIGQEFSLPNDVFHHAVNVLRMRVGDAFEIFDGHGHAARAQLSHIEKKSARANTVTVLNQAVESPLPITLAQCLSASDKMDWTIEKAVELGVTHIAPLFSNKSQIKLTPERAAKKYEHWQRIVHAACAQSGRNVLPVLEQPQTIKAFLAQQKNNDAYKLLLHPAAAVPFKSLDKPTAHQNITILIGPEAGFDANEVTNATDAGFTSTLLGPRILRTESAGLATIAALQTMWGDF